ncbi:type II toxin-antitoxin system RelE/ParE family toxin [Azospirillum sp. sgz301742]
MVRRRVILSPMATRDLEQIRTWYSQPGSGPRAKRKASAIVRALRELERYPFIGSPSDEPGLRERVVEEHTVIYRIQNDADVPESAGDIVVIRIWQPGQNRPRPSLL